MGETLESEGPEARLRPFVIFCAQFLLDRIYVWTPWTHGVELRGPRCPLRVIFLSELRRMSLERQLKSRTTSDSLLQRKSIFLNASRIIKDAVRNAAGWYLETTKAPARLEVFEFVNPESDETTYLYTSSRYSVLCVGATRLYFDRITGKFDGVSSPSQQSVADGLKLSD